MATPTPKRKRVTLSSLDGRISDLVDIVGRHAVILRENMDREKAQDGARQAAPKDEYRRMNEPLPAAGVDSSVGYVRSGGTLKRESKQNRAAAPNHREGSTAGT